MNVLWTSALFGLAAICWWPVNPRQDWLSRIARGQRIASEPGSRFRVVKPAKHSAAIIAVASLIGWLLGATPGAALGCLLGLLLAAALNRESAVQQRRRALQIAQAPAVFDLIGCAMQAGLPLSSAVQTVAAIAPEPSCAVLQRVTAHLNVGCSQREAWTQLRAEPGWTDISRDLAACADGGSALAELFFNAAEDARNEALGQLQTQARAISVRSVLPMMVCFLPSFVLVGVVPIIAGVLANGLFGS